LSMALEKKNVSGFRLGGGMERVLPYHGDRTPIQDHRTRKVSHEST